MGKSSTPEAPDYSAAAKATADGNLDAAKYATEANRINQYTPYGSLTYTKTPGDSSVDYDAYNKALNDYNKSLDAYNRYSTSSGAAPNNNGNSSSSLIAQSIAGKLNGVGAGAFNGIAPNRPDINNYKKAGADKWSQKMELTPEAQEALDQQLSLNKKYGEVANIGFDRARDIFENPELDLSQLPDRAINVGQTAQDAILSRLNPQLNQQDEQLRSRLANQGIGLGTEAYGREMALSGQRSNDLRMQAALQGISLDQQNRSSALQEQAYLQDRPLNLINALRTGNQVQAPQFQNFAQQQTTQGPDMMGAANAQYGSALDASNASNASDSNMMGGLFSIAGTALGGPLGGALASGLYGAAKGK